MTDPLRNRMQQWEAEPPQGLWDNISRELNEGKAEQRIRERLAALETVPPVQSWQSIAREISEPVSPVETPIIPIRPLYPYLFRYAAVAIVAGIMAWLLIDRPFSTPSNEIVTSIIEPPAPRIEENKAIVADAGNKTGRVADAPAVATQEPEDPQREPRHSSIRQIPELPQVEQKPVQLSVNLPAQRAVQELHVQNRNPRYITITNEAGEQVRLSAKFAYLYYKQLTGSEQPKLNEIMNRLQQHLSQRPIVPDPANLLDMLRLRDLAEKEK